VSTTVRKLSILGLVASFPFVTVALGDELPAQIEFTSVPNFPDLPNGQNFGEVPGVAVNSDGHVFVFSRSAPALAGPASGP